eukprot:NODE_44_length_2049_cov_489.247138_g43_i0.p1 GENE.NODE_44_length_2049_cov_489.247138_g43_i0~~NODE_44_length_2049_cov_489.247138_g43_i0.p1  ORF type:complete len:622 (+),score=151.43 NODE_44_length_2049_cov_489.247138_g43_i0:144-2009(+)
MTFHCQVTRPTPSVVYSILQIEKKELSGRKELKEEEEREWQICRDEWVDSCLIAAGDNGDLDMMTFLWGNLSLVEREEFHKKTRQDNRPYLHYAMLQRNLPLVRWLVDHPPSLTINSANSLWETQLKFTRLVRTHQLQAEQLYLLYFVWKVGDEHDAETLCKGGGTLKELCLVYACEAGCLGLIRALADEETSLDACVGATGDTLLDIAALNDHDTAELLLDVVATRVMEAVFTEEAAEWHQLQSCLAQIFSMNSPETTPGQPSAPPAPTEVEVPAHVKRICELYQQVHRLENELRAKLQTQAIGGDQQSQQAHDEHTELVQLRQLVNEQQDFIQHILNQLPQEQDLHQLHQLQLLVREQQRTIQCLMTAIPQELQLSMVPTESPPSSASLGGEESDAHTTPLNQHKAPLTTDTLEETKTKLAAEQAEQTTPSAPPEPPTEAEETIHTLQAELKDRDQQIDSLLQATVTTQRLQTEVNSRDQQIDILQYTLQQRDVALSKAKLIAEQQEVAAQTLQTKLNERDQQISILQAKYDAAVQEVQEAKLITQQAEDTIQTLQAKLDGLDHDQQRLQEENGMTTCTTNGSSLPINMSPQNMFQHVPGAPTWLPTHHPSHTLTKLAH